MAGNILCLNISLVSSKCLFKVWLFDKGGMDDKRGSYRGIPVMRDWLILFSVKREFNKLFFVIRDLKVLRDP